LGGGSTNERTAVPCHSLNGLARSDHVVSGPLEEDETIWKAVGATELF
jgi:hypothetical protein